MTTVTETNSNQQEEGIIITNREIPSSCVKEQHQPQESHSTAKPSRLDVSSSDCEEMPPQPGAVHMIGSRVMTAEQQEEDAWDLEENDDEEDNENEVQEEERPPSVDLGTASLHSNRSSSCTVEAGNSEDAAPVILKESYVLPTEIQAEAVDEQQEAKLLEILHAPVVHGETVSPGYARYLLPISLTCTLLSVMGIAGMAVFVFVIRPSEVQPIPTVAPTLAPSFMPTMTVSMYPTIVAPPLSSTLLVPSNDTMLDITGGGNGTETIPPVLSPLPEISDGVPVSTPIDIPLGRTTMPPSPDSEKAAAKKPTLVPTSIPTSPPKRDNLDSSPSQPSTLAMGFISTLIALTAVIAVLAFVAHWQIRKRAQGQQQAKEQSASDL